MTWPAASNITEDAHRWRCAAPVKGLPELLILGQADFKEAYPLGEHLHQDAYEFVVIERGVAKWEIDGQVFETSAGNVFVTAPNEKHQGLYNVIAPCRLSWVVVSISDIREKGQKWLGLPYTESRRILSALQNLPRILPVSCSDHISALRRLRWSITQKGAFEEIERRLALLSFVVSILRQYEVFCQQKFLQTKSSRDMRKVLYKISEQCNGQIVISDLAKSLELSVPQFYRKFVKETGYTPKTFSSAIRIENACRLLSESQRSMTDIAYELGYSSSQHFASAFKQHTGHSPTAWRKQYGQKL